ncbi:MAG: Uma2 family endonuclease [Planctomycetia bacterium]|nr:Uma2 family endonuclease [Planctomycetia bacterium]
MATITTAETATETQGDQWVVLSGVGWKGYTAILRAKGDRRWPKAVYLDGDLYLMSPAYPHEWIADRLGILVLEVVVGLDIRCVPTGQTTFRRRKRAGGAEGDRTFYLANAPRIVGKRQLHLRRDPPPDLVIEAVNTHDAEESVEVWRRFGVPEVWVCDGKSLQILCLQPDGRYAESPVGSAFPYLKPDEILGWVNKALDETETETDWIKQLRAWVRDVLAPRARGAENEQGGA